MWLLVVESWIFWVIRCGHHKTNFHLANPSDKAVVFHPDGLLLGVHVLSGPGDTGSLPRDRTGQGEGLASFLLRASTECETGWLTAGVVSISTVGSVEATISLLSDPE